MDWQEREDGLAWDSPPYVLTISTTDKPGPVWILTRTGRKPPLGTYATVPEGARAAEAHMIQRHANAVARGMLSPGTGRPTRYPKTRDLHIELHDAGWDRIAEVAGRLKCSKSDALCGIIDTCDPETVTVPDFPPRGGRERLRATTQPPTESPAR